MTGVALLATALAPDAARAHMTRQAVGTVACAGSQTVAYSPGLTTRSQEVTIHGTSTLTRCASSSDPSITAARSSFHASGRFSCVSGKYSGTRKVSWNNGRTSTMSFNSVVSVNAGQSVVAIKGTVTDGEFSGQKWSAAFTMFTSRPQSCTTREGLPTAAGQLLLTVGSVVPDLSALDPTRPTRH
ncbi:hypothetical protein [Actinoallomurus acaciae]|uniref:Ig-like domain-containing protein n=1 Tax=Actinoallomurus acaciae TaxID=502577 RepID=A0ABV5YUB0_9ACTN